jgi:hypothetical protein
VDAVVIDDSAIKAAENVVGEVNMV